MADPDAAQTGEDAPADTLAPVRKVADPVQTMESAAVEAVVETVINKLLAFCCAQVKQVSSFENEFSLMEQRLQTTKKQISEEANVNQHDSIQACFRKLRFLMYEAEDLQTDYQIRHEYYKGICSSKCLPHNFSFYLAKAKKIKNITERIKEQKQLLQEAHHGSNSLSRNDTVQQPPKWDGPSEEMIGIEDDVKTIRDWIVCSDSDHKFRKIAIVGMAGLGKTALAKRISNDAGVKKHFLKTVRVSVSQTSRLKVLKEILQQLEENSASETADADLLNRIISLLKETSCLIILEDIWSNNDLKWWKKDFFGAISRSSPKKCCTIVTTRDEDVANAVGGGGLVHKLRFLDETNSLSLFNKQAEAEGNCTPNLVRNIVARCGGLPLAIKTMGDLLGSADSSDDLQGIWEKFSESCFQREKNEVINSLQLSYKALPEELKQCLSSMCIFPEGYEIEADRLIHWWVAEGLLQGERQGFENLSKLAKKCLIQVVETRGYRGRIYKCKMHNMVRYLTLVMAQDNEHCFFDHQGKQKLNKYSRWLSFTSDTDPNSLKETSNLRALVLMDENIVELHKNFRLDLLVSLRALDFSDNKLEIDSLNRLFRWISCLWRLAYLNLSGSQNLQEVPDSIGKLRNLQRLILRGCTNLLNLSSSIKSLKRLLVLDVSFCDQLRYLPKLKRLSQLQELSGLILDVLSNKKSCRLLELQHLPKLCVLRMRLSEDSEIGENERSILSKLKALKVLAMDFDENLDAKRMLGMIDGLSLPPTIEQLYLKGYNHESLPKWVCPESLPKLVRLCIEEGQRLTNICTGGGRSWDVEGLCLKELPELEMDWDKLINEKMKLLHYAEVGGCPKLKNFPINEDIPVKTWLRNSHCN